MSTTIVGSTDDGFTLVELLVVMIILGVVAAIAIPVFLTQRAKAHDASTKTDVTNVGKEIATYYVDGGVGLSLDLAVEPGRGVLSDGTWSQSIQLTNGTAAPTAGSTSALDNATGWCVSLTDPDGQVKDFKYTARSGLETGTCT